MVGYCGCGGCCQYLEPRVSDAAAAVVVVVDDDEGVARNFGDDGRAARANGRVEVVVEEVPETVGDDSCRDDPSRENYGCCCGCCGCYGGCCYG